MKMTDEMMHGVFALLTQFGATKEQAVEIAAVLYHGNEKHGADDCDALHHIGRAKEHLDRYCIGEQKEDESGQPHTAHAIARLVLAIERLVRVTKGQ